MKKKILRKRKSNTYFTKDHQKAIVEYALTGNKVKRTELYIEWIEPAFNEMVEKIVFTYKFNNLPNIECLKDECKIWLTTILNKFDPDKGSKAFSYFSVITKNWFIYKVKKNAKQLKREIYLEDLSRELENAYLSISNEYIERREKHEFWCSFEKEIKKWDNLKLKENERRVLEAVKILFDSAEDIEIFNKKAVYLYIREITGLNTKQVVNNLNKIRSRYRDFKKNWDEGKN